jgi:hypothetical protein
MNHGKDSVAENTPEIASVSSDRSRLGIGVMSATARCPRIQRPSSDDPRGLLPTFHGWTGRAFSAAPPEDAGYGMSGTPT